MDKIPLPVWSFFLYLYVYVNFDFNKVTAESLEVIKSEQMCNLKGCANYVSTDTKLHCIPGWLGTKTRLLWKVVLR